MSKRRWILLLLSFTLPLFLMSCSSAPPEADGWEYDSKLEQYSREIVYLMNDDKTRKYLELHEGTWTADEDSEVAIIIEDDLIHVGLHSDYFIYPVSSFKLEEREYKSKKDNYETGSTFYSLSLKVPDIFCDIC